VVNVFVFLLSVLCYDPRLYDEIGYLANVFQERWMSLGRGSRAPLAAVDGLTIFALRGIAPDLLHAVQALWTPARLPVSRRTPPAPLPPLAPTPPGKTAVEVVPVFDGGELVALVYVETAAVAGEPDLAGVARVSREMAVALRRGASGEASARESFLERTGVEDFQREKLLLLLERHRWNIARVARLMGLTRRTIYLRLRRYGVARKRVRRAGARKPRP
jgi:hypothetical protein